MIEMARIPYRVFLRPGRRGNPRNFRPISALDNARIDEDLGGWDEFIRLPKVLEHGLLKFLWLGVDGL